MSICALPGMYRSVLLGIPAVSVRDWACIGHLEAVSLWALFGHAPLRSYPVVELLLELYAPRVLALQKKKRDRTVVTP